MKLQKNVSDDALVLRFLVDKGKQFFRVNALNNAHLAHKLFHLIGLKMTYEMPFYIGRQVINLRKKLLHTAFTEDMLSGGICLADTFLGVELGDCYQPNTFRQHRLDILYIVADGTQLTTSFSGS